MRKYSFADALVHPNNFDLLRLIAAGSVLFGHSFIIAHGPNAPGDPVSEFVAPYLPWNEAVQDLAVNAFFVISGFLIAASFERSERLWDFVKARVLRIFPACIVCSIITVIALFSVSAVDIVTYAASPETAKFLFLNAFIIDIHYYLPGVFATNPYPLAVNGSLWTLPIELRCYVLLTILGLVGLFRYQWFGFLGAAIVFLSMIVPGGTEWISGDAAKARLILFFLTGALFCLYRCICRQAAWVLQWRQGFLSFSLCGPRALPVKN